MKRFLCFWILWMLSSTLVLSENVPKQEVIKVAVEACTRLSGKDFSRRMAQVTPVIFQGTVCYYLVQFQPDGWVLVAADDRVTPVLGYSPNGKFQLAGQPVSMQTWFEGYASKIQNIKKNPSLSRHSNWSQACLKSSTEKIDPIIKVNWNQGGAYAQYCPINNKGQRALVGCVAVAMAQAMSVLQFPVHPKGEMAYEDDDMGFVKVLFDKEEDYNWQQILSGGNNKSEVARLLYHCGVAVRMNYGLSSSGAFTKDIPKALKAFFSYSDDVHFYNRSSYGGDWKALILTELQEGRPVIYSGYDPAGHYGHAFNLDGFDGSNSFFVNWGWGGVNNGYYSLDNLRDGNYDYRDNHQIVVGIKSADTPSCSQKIEKEGVKVYTSGKYCIVSALEEGVCTIYSLSGQLIGRNSFPCGEMRIPLASTGIYIVNIKCGNKQFSLKVYAYDE